jgi:signal transduction histidine kinase
LQSEGLTAGLDKQAVSLRARHKILVECDFCAEPDVELNIKEAVYRIAQEALHNTVKHAHAQRISLALRVEANHLVIDETDDGVGFDPAAIYPGHLGLLSMRERAERLGGILEIASGPGQGTRVRARIPAVTVRSSFAGAPGRTAPY